MVTRSRLVANSSLTQDEVDGEYVPSVSSETAATPTFGKIYSR